MAEPVIQEISGLQLSNNTFSASPPGSLAVADNIVIPQKSVAQPRNGQQRVAETPGSSRPRSLTEHLGTLIVNHCVLRISFDYGLGYVSGTSFVPFTAFGGIFNPVDCLGNGFTDTEYWRMKFGFAGSYMHFCTQEGPRTQEAPTAEPRVAGLQRMPDLYGNPEAATDNNWLPYNSSVAYRSVLRRPTSDGTSLLSPPSGRAIVTNRLIIPVGGLVRSGGTVTATLFSGTVTGLQVGDTFTLSPGELNFAAGTYTVTATPTTHSFRYANAGAAVASTIIEEADTGPRVTRLHVPLPFDAQVGDSVRLYRSLVTSLSTVVPSDELYLCAEVLLASADIVAGLVVVLDATPQSVIDNPLYTNPQTGEGALSANIQPPIYRDVTSWDGKLWYANTTGQQSMRLEMLGVGAPGGIQDLDGILFADGSTSIPFRFTVTPSSPTDVQIVSDGTPSENIQATAANLVKAFEAIGTPGWNLYNDSQDGAIPGKLLLQRSMYQGIWSYEPIQVTATRPASWTPALDPAIPVLTDNNRRPNGLLEAKPGQPEAVPPANFSAVGVKNYAIRRVFGLRNAMLVCKEGDGIWAQTGAEGAYSLRQISTANIIAPDCAAVLADQLWVYTDQGLLRVSDSGGASVVSRPIEVELNRLFALFPQDTFEQAFAVPYETERRIMFYMPQEGSEVGAPLLQAWCYNMATNAWTRFNATALCGVVTAQPRLWLGIADTLHVAGRLTVERKTQTYEDLADASWDSSISSYEAGTRTVVLSDALGVRVGTGLQQGVWRTKVSEVLAANTFTLEEGVPLAPGACTVFDNYPVELQFQPSGNPTSRKVLTRLATFWKPAEFANFFGTTTLLTDQLQAELTIPTPSLGFGLTVFGVDPFGTPSPLVVDSNPIDAKWVNAAEFFAGFRLDEVWAKFKLQGVSMTVDPASGPAGRGK